MPPAVPPDDARRQATQILTGIFTGAGAAADTARAAAEAYVAEAARMLASGTAAAAGWREDLHPRGDHGKFTSLEEGSGGRHAGPGSFEHIRSINDLASQIETASRAAGTTSETASALRNVAHHVALRQVGVAKTHMDDALHAARRERVGTGVMRQLRAVAASLDKIPAGTAPEPGFGMLDRHRTPAPPALRRHHPAGPGYFPERVHQAAGQQGVVEHHPACPPRAPHGSVTASGHLLACHTTPQEAQDLALHLDISDAGTAPGGGTADSPAVTPAAAAAAAIAGLGLDGDAAELAAEIAEWNDIASTIAAGGDVAAVSEGWKKNEGNAERLRQYWSHGEGAAKIRWGTNGDFDRCVSELRKYVKDPQAYCAERHHDALGIWPATHARLVREGKSVPQAAFNPEQARDWHGRWSLAGGGEHGLFPAGQIRKGHHVVIGGKIWHVDRVQHAPGDPQRLIQLHMTSTGNDTEHISPVVHPDKTLLTRVEPAAEPGVPPHEAQQYAGFLPPGVRLSEATQAQLKQARRKAMSAASAGGDMVVAFNPHELRNRLGEWSHGGDTGKGKGTGEHEAYSRAWTQLAADISETRTHLSAAHPAADYLRDAQHSAEKESRHPGGRGLEDHAGSARGNIAIARTRHAARPAGGEQVTARISQHLATAEALLAHRDRLFPVSSAGAAGPRLPALVTIPDVDLLAAGTWNLSTGRQTFTPGDLESAVEAEKCPAVGPPVIKIGHLDKRFAPGPDDDGEPTIGRVANMRIEGAKLRGDLAGMPGWLASIAPSAYPRRSVEGKYRFQCQIGHSHPFVVTAVALLGVTPPGVGVLGGLDDIAALYGMPTTAAAAGASWRTDPTDTEETTVPISEEDVRRAYYAAGVPQSYWITELQMTPTQLIVADEQSGKLYRVPFRIDGSAVTFGGATELASYAEVAAGRGNGPVAVWASAAESRAVTAAGWDGAAAVRNLGDDPPSSAIRALFAIPGDSKSDSSLPHHEVSADGKVGAASPQGCSAAIAALNGARGGLTGVSASAKKAAYSHLAAHLRDAGREPPEFNAAAAEAEDWELVEAARRGGMSSEDPSRTSSDAPGDAASSEAPNAGPHPPFQGKHSHPHPAYGGAAAAAFMTTKGCPPGMHLHEHSHDGDAAHDHGHTSAAAGPAESHDDFDGEHSHPHAAYGDQGGDQTHTHKHRHKGDAVHRHVHDPVSAAPQAAASAEGGSDVEFSDDQMAAIRQRLGKRDGEPVTAGDIAAVFASPTVKATAGGDGQAPGDLPVITPGTYLVDGEVIRDWQARAAAGDHAVAKMRIAERDTVLADAMSAGKFPQSRLPHYQLMWERDPDGTRRHVEALAAGLVPVGTGPSGQAGFDAELGEFEGASAYADLYPEDLKGGVSAAPGIPQLADYGRDARQGGARRG